MSGIEELNSILKSQYNHNNYDKFVLGYLKKINKINAKEENSYPNVFKEYIAEYDLHSTYVDPEGENVIILSIKIKDNKKVSSGARTMHRNFVSYLLENVYQDFSYALVAFYGNNDKTWKLSFVTVDYHITDKGLESYYKPVRRYSFIVGPNEPTRTYLSQLKVSFTNPKKLPLCEDILSAFSVDKVTNDFYNEYKKKFFELESYLISSEEFISESERMKISVDKFAKSFAKKTLGQIVFIYFLQRKGWLGVDENWGDGDKNYLRTLYLEDNNKNYFDDFLEPLFYEALNERRNNYLFKGLKVPYLNGGIFNPINDYSWKNTCFGIPNKFFSNKNESGFLDILDSFNFTVYESDPLEQDIAIDPEMLGRIFESLLEIGERKDKGAFYTPREVVHYMCQTTLAKKISEKLDLNYQDIYKFVQYKEFIKNSQIISDNCFRIDKYLSELKILDPALGSGAFLVGMLNEISKLRNVISNFLLEYLKIDKQPYDRSIYKLKLDLIENSLYGVDIEPDAIEVAKLRLWLSLIVDENIIRNNAPDPLPNLTYNLRIGNSLMTSFKGIELDTDFKIDMRTSRNKVTIRQIKSEIAQYKEKFYRISNKVEKNKIINKIDLLTYDYLHMILRDKAKETKILEYISELPKIRDVKPFFLWSFEFSRVFDQNRGFDIIIANPPYGLNFDDNTKKILKKKYPNVPDYESAYYFMALSKRLLNETGIMAYIVPNTILTNLYAKKFRNELLKDMSLLSICDLSQVRVFASAEVRNCVLELGAAAPTTKPVTMIKGVDEDGISLVKINDAPVNLLKKNIKSWLNVFYLTPIDIQIIDKLQKCKYTIDDLCEVSQGLIPYDKYKGHSTQTIKNRVWHADSRKDDTYKKELKGKDVTRYNVKWNGENWISYGEWLAAPRKKDFFVKNRILVREITNPRIYAGPAFDEYYNTPSIINIINFEKLSIYYILGLLNSKLYSFYHLKSSPKSNKGSFPKILINDIRDIPIKKDCKNGEISEIEKFVKLIIQNINNEETKQYEEKIDKLVYKLFDISEKEIKQIESFITE